MPTEAKYGVPVQESWLVPRGAIYVIEGRSVAHPSVMMAIKVGRTPLWTRHMLGVIESERDRRRRRKRR